MYKANAYLCTNFAGLMDDLETDLWSDVEEFVWKNCQRGLDVEIIDTETGNHSYAYAAAFNENIIEPAEMILDNTEHHKSDLVMIISRANKLEEFMETYELWNLKDATESQLREYITQIMYKEEI